MLTITDEERAERAEAIGDLLEEFGDKNHVRVVKFEACKGKNGRISLHEVQDELAKIGCLPPSLMLADSIRMLAGKKPIYMAEVFKRFGGDLVGVMPNGRVNTGIDFCANALGGTQPAQADWIALSNNTSATGATDSSNTLPWSSAQATDGAAGTGRGEYTALGVARKNSTYAHTTSVASYTQSATWTATGACTSLQMAGMFGGSTKTAQGSATATDILFVENTFTATSLATSDQLSLTWTVNI